MDGGNSCVWFSIRNCCNFGRISYNTAIVGAICGNIESQGAMEKCYYLKDNDINAFGIVNTSKVEYNMVAYFESLDNTNFVYLNDTTEDASYTGDLLTKLNKYSNSQTSSIYRIYHKWGIDDKTGNIIFIKE